MHGFEQPISEYIWNLKYRYQHQDHIVDHTVEDTWQRVAAAAASVETKNINHWTRQFYSILENFTFLPGGRIIAGAGISEDVTLFNCFVMNIKEDSVVAIFDGLKEGALTLQKGGGVGYDFSNLRPRGHICYSSQAVATGPVSFMKVWDAMSATMMSSASRRGAMMANLRCDHPDIEEFISIKADKQELRQFNLSVIVTNEFMDAVMNDENWQLVFPVTPGVQKTNIIYRRWSNSSKLVPCEILKVVRAKELWRKIIHAAYDYAEPGVIFEDIINNDNPLNYHEWISATNPCGEIPLPRYGACNLGSLNLVNFVRNPFTPHASFDFPALEQTIIIATRFLDNIVDVSYYPLKVQRDQSYLTRRLGLGFTGLANALIMLGISYGSDDSLKLIQKITQTIAYITWAASCSLAEEKGSFPCYNQKYLQTKFFATLPEDLQKDIAKKGMRNSHHNAIAPTGSISLLANNISSGLEPAFSTTYSRTIKTTTGESHVVSVQDYAYFYWQKLGGHGKPPAWVEISSLTPEDHLNVQGVVQPYIDNAISKTINLPEEFPFEQLHQVYTKAFELNLKGCTIFRPNPVTGSILTNDPPECESCYE